MSNPILEPKAPEPKTPSGGVKHAKEVQPSPDLMPPADAEEKEAAHAAEPKPQATTPAPADAQAKADAQVQPNPNPWLKPLGWLSLSGLDDIDPVNVRNSMAFKLGALAGSLPALSVISLTKFMTPDQAGALAVNSSSGGNFLAALGVLVSSALVGGAVAFFWAENRLRTIFTYGVAGPAVVLSMFLSGVSNLATNQKIADIKQSSKDKLEKDTQKIQADATNHLQNEMQKVISSANVAPVGASPTSSQASAAAAANPDLAPP